MMTDLPHLEARIADLLRLTTTLYAELAARDERVEGLEYKLHLLRQWATAYPIEAFPLVTDAEMESAEKVLKEHNLGHLMGRMHGSWARHIFKGIDKIIGEK
jgi:hypothetical protein